IFCQPLGIGLRTLPVSCGHHHELVQVLDVPSAFAEFDCKPVEQLGMGWTLAHNSEIFSRLHQTRAEKLVPHPIHCDPGRKGILGTDRPSRERKSISRLVRWQGWKEVGGVGFYSL